MIPQFEEIRIQALKELSAGVALELQRFAASFQGRTSFFSAGLG